MASRAAGRQRTTIRRLMVRLGLSYRAARTLAKAQEKSMPSVRIGTVGFRFRLIYRQYTGGEATLFLKEGLGREGAERAAHRLRQIDTAEARPERVRRVLAEWLD